MSSDQPLFSQPGVLTASEGTPPAVGIRWAILSGDNGKTVKVKLTNGKTEQFDASRLTQQPRTDRIVFVSNGVTYKIRELREEDGLWLSRLRTPVPVDALETIILQGDDNMQQESITAYALDDSPYVVGVVYEGPTGSFVRTDGEWAQLSSQDTTFSGANVFAFEINPDKVDEFIELYDQNWVSITDAEKYESADSE